MSKRNDTPKTNTANGNSQFDAESQKPAADGITKFVVSAEGAIATPDGGLYIGA
jgi:hypothetical protein